MDNKILATVNGMDITSDVLDRTIEQLPPERKAYFQSEFGRKQLLEQLVSVELINAFGLGDRSRQGPDVSYPDGAGREGNQVQQHNE